MKAAKKAWAEYKKTHNLSEDKIKEDFGNNIDHLARCFREQCPPSKRAKQRNWELLNLQNPADRHQMADNDLQFSMYQLINESQLTSDDEPDSDSPNNVSGSSVEVSFGEEDEV